MASLEERLGQVLEESTPEEQAVLATVLILAATAPAPDGDEVEGFNARFQIQDLMSRYNQAEALASNVLKKHADTKNSIIGKF